MTDYENPMNTLYGHSKNIYNPNITLTKGTSNRDAIVILLSDSIKR